MRTEILGVPIDWLSREELKRKLELFVISGKAHQIVTVNPEFVVLSQKFSDFKEILNNAELSLADGAGIVVAQNFYNAKPPKSIVTRSMFYLISVFTFLISVNENHQRITGVELADILMAEGAKNGWKVYLLGSGPGVAEAAATVWHNKYPEVQIVGASGENPDDHDVVAKIVATKPDILLVTYGAPKQERFIATNKSKLNVPIMVGVGGTFDYVSGNIKRAPGCARAIGLEWIFRLVQQPKRFARVWRSTITFSKLIIKNK